MTTTSSAPQSSVPWPEAAHYPPPQPPGQAADRPDHPAGPEPLFPPAAPPTPGPKGPRSWSGRLRTLPARTWRGRADDPAWVRPALLGLLLATAALYGWNLTASGWANSFYSAAVQAGTQSWQAFFYGSSDAANFITVDKPPMSLWPMELTARLFGLSSFTVLAPEVLMGVATVGVLYATVRRRFSPLAGLLAGAALALTPVAALMFRFNNPDALLVLLLTLAAYAFVRATESASTRWLLLAGVMFGFGFLTKTLQAFLILPAFALVYLVVAPTGLWRRLRQLLAAGLALVLAGGWWVAVVQLVPAADRPYVGGSQDDSFLSLTFGYNGFGRLTGNETGSVGGGAAAPGGGGGAGGGGGPHWGSTGLTRLFGSDLGGQIGWLLPAALVLLLLGLWATRRAPRTDAARTAFLVWGGWLLSTGLTFSYMSGIFHQYYTVALAPAVAALVGMGVDGLWRARRRLPYAALLAVLVGGTALWAYLLLGRSAGFVPWLRWVVLLGGLGAALVLLAAGRLAGRAAARWSAVGGVLALAAGLGGPAAYAVDTVASAHTGSIPTAGPQVAGGGFPGGGRPGGGAPGGTRGAFPRGGFPGGAGGAFPGGGAPGGGAPGGSTTGGFPGGGRPAGAGGGTRGGGGMGGLIDGAQVSPALATLLKADAANYTWPAATVGSQNAASYQLATREPVMALGGFNGSDPSLSLAAFQQDVRQGRIHYFIGGGGFGAQQGGSDDSSQITAWVSAHYTAKTVGSATVYDLTAPTTS
ncbi:4-amino-4-deoxy-L-arabinose transferase-like glycosyltransferase [Kitasatospora sp. GAS204A]|uniref:glycosyltransferase family 39 protein n=1 Tax=unclassified Kitasatospora TaxID=2633591 RepID=UPI002475DBA2|nr:glycosyltransferase family 39 protein [Kitasatospora sp. GAS204B]MDH6116111.1 4-amino-4-deoxy-L-arabinose transferase-like glycosyltransferase [Kitasatospora sp. GAS204B]